MFSAGADARSFVNRSVGLRAVFDYPQFMTGRNVENWIEIKSARANNLKDIDVRFPVGRLSVITGISSDFTSW